MHIKVRGNITLFWPGGNKPVGVNWGSNSKYPIIDIDPTINLRVLGGFGFGLDLQIDIGFGTK